MLDQSYSLNSKPARRFFMRRLKDETSISGDGRVVDGILFQNGEIYAQWRPKRPGMYALNRYNDLAEFRAIHMDIHPGMNEIVWVDNDLGTQIPTRTSPFRRFYVMRTNDRTGKSRTGRIIEGVMLQTGQILFQWRPPLSSVTLYPDFEGMAEVQLSHPSENEVFWL